MAYPSPFAEAYSDALRELTTNELAKIKLLRDLAEENLSEAANIVTSVERHLLTCPVAHRLPAIYLVDCIIKTAPNPYLGLFSPKVAGLFAHVWDTASPDVRAKLKKTASTWRGVLPAAVIATIEAKHTPAPTLPPAPVQQTLLFPAQAPGPSVGYGTQGQPIVLNPAYGGLPGAPVILAPPSAQVQPQVTYTLLQSAPGQPGGYAIVQQPGPAYGQPPSTVIQYVTAAGQPAPNGLPSSSTPPLPVQPAYMQGGPHLQAGPGSLASSLLGLGLQRGAGHQAGSHPNLAGMNGSGGGAPPSADQLLTQQALKEFNQQALESLTQASDASRGKFLDVKFLRNRRLQSAQHQVRHWFTNVDQWLQGSGAAEEVAVSFFEEEQGKDGGGTDTLAGEQQPLPLVEEDPSQPKCAISGEQFDRIYDPDTDKWYYEDAVILTGEQAELYGVMDGSIVKVHSLAGAPPALAASLGLAAAIARVGSGVATPQAKSSVAPAKAAGDQPAVQGEALTNAASGHDKNNVNNVEAAIVAAAEQAPAESAPVGQKRSHEAVALESKAGGSDGAATLSEQVDISKRPRLQQT